MIIGAIIIGIFILALITLGLYIGKRCDDNFDVGVFDVGVFLGMMLAALIIVETALVAGIIYGPRPSAIDVYRGNTELEITSINAIPTDTVVVFKKELK